MKKEIKEGKLYEIERKLTCFKYDQTTKNFEELQERRISKDVFIVKGIKDLGKKEFAYLCEILGTNITTDIFREDIIDFQEVNFSCS